MNRDLYFYYLSRIIDIIYSFIVRYVPSKVHGKIVMFHHISNENIDEIDSCLCRIDQFIEILNSLEREGYRFVSIDEVLDIIRLRRRDKFVAISFDDIPSSVYMNAYSILRERKIPFAIYVATGYIDKEGFISTEQLLEMAETDLCTVRAHRVSHPKQRFSNTAYGEIKESKLYLERLLKREIKHFAYPYGKIGAVSRNNKILVKEVGFCSAVSTIASDITVWTGHDLFCLPRVVIN